VGKAVPDGYTPLPNGDTNCDEELSALDVLITLSGIVGRNVSTFCYGQSIVAKVEITPAGPVTLTSFGATQALVALAKEGAGAVVSGQVFVWASDGDTVVTVASDGTVTAVAFTWASNNASVATVGADGTVTGVTDGSEVTAQEIAEISRHNPILEAPRESDRVSDVSFGREIFLRRRVGNARVTIFEGAHEGLAEAAVAWFEAHPNR